MRVRISRVRVHRDSLGRFARDLADLTGNESVGRKAENHLRAGISFVVADSTGPVPAWASVVPYRAGDRA